MTKAGYHTYSWKAFAERYDLGRHQLFDVLDDMGIARHEPNVWVAGGAVRAAVLGQPLSSDIDFFCSSPDAFAAFVNSQKEHPGFREGHENDHNVTFTMVLRDKPYKVQAIRIAYFASPEESLDSFDFTICQFALSGDKLIVGEYALWDLARKRLAVHRVTYGVATVRRLLKYARQGFTACNGAIATILNDVSSDPAKIRSDVKYID